MRVGIAHHLGWAVAVTASDDFEVVDRRRIELIEPGLPNAPVHHEGGAHEMHRTGPPLDDDTLAALVEEVRASVERSTRRALDKLASEVPETIVSISLRAWPTDFPSDVPTQRQLAYEAKADSVMYRQSLADAALDRGWSLHLFDAKDVEAEASQILGARAKDVLEGPRKRLGAPWAKDHRIALAATVLAARTRSS